MAKCPCEWLLMWQHHKIKIKNTWLEYSSGLSIFGIFCGIRARGPRLSLFDMLLRLGGLSGDPSLSLFDMLLRLGVLSGSPRLSLFDMLLRLGVLSGSPPLSLFDMLLSVRGGSGTWCSLCDSLGWFFCLLGRGPSILFIVFPPFFFFGVLWFIWDWQGFISHECFPELKLWFQHVLCPARLVSLIRNWHWTKINELLNQ